MTRRLLPWTGDGGQPAYLTTYGEGSFMSRWADSLESVQLAMAERLLHRAESAWAVRIPGTDMTGLVPDLCHALRDVLRVARSRGATRGISGEATPPALWDGPWTVAYRWPSEPEYVRAARRALRRHLAQWDMTALVDTAELVLSELFTNSVRHATGPDERLVETRYQRLPDGSLRIEVHDTDESGPRRKEPSADADSGRGLLLVDALTGGRWGVSDREGIGKRVWAICAEYPHATPA